MKSTLFVNHILEVIVFPKKNDEGQFVIEQKKKKCTIIQEGKKQVDIPPDVGEEEKKALEQTGDDATSSW